MRKFLSSTAGASFNQEVATQTICVRKDCVELIYKVKPSVYVVVSMLHVSDGGGDALCELGGVFRPVAEPAGADAEDREMLSDAVCRDDGR